MSWFESIIYGLVSGISDFLPISSRAHQSLLLLLFGETTRDYFRDLVVHIALLLSVFTACRNTIDQLKREQILRQRNRKTRSGAGSFLEMRLIKNATLPMILGLLVVSYISSTGISLIWVSVLLVLNGLILYTPERMLQGNKDERAMSGLDSLLLGSAGALSALPGISRTGTMLSVLSSRGAEQQKALNWVLLLSIPALGTWIGLDIINLFSASAGVPFWPNLGGYILSGISAYIGGYVGVSVMRILKHRTGYSGFAYYSWGAALFTFILYLTVV